MMDTQKIKEQLNAIYSNLNSIEVKGEINIGLLFGAISSVKNLFSELENSSPEINEK